MSLLGYESLFSSLKLNSRGGGEKSPHKVAMLLAVLDLVDRGTIVENRIDFDQSLKEAFSHQFGLLASEMDRDNPHLPYFHLRSSGFWHHRIKPGKSASYSNLTTVTGAGTISEVITYAHLDDELFELLGNGVARELLQAALHRNLTQEDRSVLLDVGSSWDWLECEAIVQDYFAMLNMELTGLRYSKAEHRRGLLPKINNRSEGSIEFKHQNISAVLLEMGQPYIQGYRPAFNYQYQLSRVVLAFLAGHQTELDQILEAADVDIVEAVVEIDWSQVLDLDVPERIAEIKEPERKFLARKTNYTEREQNNRKLGERGEAFVVEFERNRLEAAGRSDLAQEIQWSSVEYGDGLGYDVRSFQPELDEELYIEVKTTNSGKYQPFFISANELAFSKEQAQHYSLYRVFDFKARARIFQLPGAVDQHAYLQAQSFKASFS